jgi:Flp pilus assembly protein TadG
MSRPVADERGAISTFLAVIALALLMAAGLAIDGGRKVTALREASHLADNAARAGAQAVDLDTLRTAGDLRLSADQVAARVDQYLAPLGHTANVTVSGDTVTVTISLTVDPLLLPTGPITVTATETAAAITQEP